MKLPCTLRASLLFSLILTPALLPAQTAHRQAALNVEIRNLSGEPIEGAQVTVEMVNHAFRFGAAISAGQIEPGNGGFDQTAVDNLQRYFNSVTYENIMKWSQWESRSEARNLELVRNVFTYRAFFSDEPMRMRGHATIWGTPAFVPNDVEGMSDGAQVRTRILDHITAHHTTLRGEGIDSFDLYNEPFHETTLLIDKIVPNSTLAEHGAEVATWFNRAKEADPDAVLIINEYNMLNFWQENDADIHEYKALVDAVRDAGGQIDGIGLQAHMDRFTTKEQMLRRMDVLAAPMAPTANFPDGLPGLPIEVTELDINTQQWTTATPAQQAEVTASVLEASWEHPAVTGVTIWVMNDSDHWRGNALMFDDSSGTWEVKPSGQAWIDRVTGTWWTNDGGISDATGGFTANVTKGTYRVTVSHNGETQTFDRDVTDTTTVQAQFDAPGGPVDTSNSRLSNLSVRTTLAAEQRLTIGFVMDGAAKDLLVRTAGPALGDFGLNGMPDPVIEVYNSGPELIASNDDWDSSLSSTFGPLGAFAFVDGSQDAALVQAVSGPNTAQTLGSTGGVVLVEAYDTDPGNGSKLVNLSANNLVGTGSDILIAGFAVHGTGHKRLLIRAIGPQLAEFGVAGTLADPKLEIFQGDTLLGSNDNWSGSLSGTFTDVGAFQLDAGSNDAATLVILEAGKTYTVAVSGADGGTGIALVEVYEVE